LNGVYKTIIIFWSKCFNGIDAVLTLNAGIIEGWTL